jgi:hypothetical protein
MRRWVGACDGLSSWAEAVELMKRSNYTGPVCLTAEYSDHDGKPLAEEQVLPLVSADFLHLRQLLA